MNGCGEILLNDRCPEELGERGRFSPKGLGTGWGIFDVGKLGITGACGVSPDIGGADCAGCTGGGAEKDWKAGCFGGATGEGAEGVKGANIVFGRGAGAKLKILSIIYLKIWKLNIYEHFFNSKYIRC